MSPYPTVDALMATRYTASPTPRRMPHPSATPPATATAKNTDATAARCRPAAPSSAGVPPPP
ncbi:hypothetical protein BU14_0272s0022 [Porphyra umbilicalis]|uniref:Uncharacterized protein n=1 Tax=Porphyra umbilicalis TaxID=2786 RepID=A0A1X6P1F9_PORUM|nr:hypothetical protein BU14_0272s0022 [Porphyra umbilicalis]|eukprot:OSX74704.1 hypothetical protein BU14_0272s0022 [Porphyra umbilicalis]